jgi:signal-transduction protein with cAMP-binding, CBS, and nucleotidyltransferase domain
VEASTEGTIMIIRHKIIFANLKFTNLLNCHDVDVHDLQFNDLFEIDWQAVIILFTDPNKSVVLETKLKCSNHTFKEVVISVSKVKYGKDEGYIVVAKEVTRQKRLELGTADLSQDLQLSLLLMNQPIVSFVKETLYCQAESTIKEVASLLARKKQDVAFVKLNDHLVGSVDTKVLTTRAMAKNLSHETTVSEIMTSPVIKIQDDALLYEALLLFKNEGVCHLLVKNLQDEIIGKLSYNDALGVQHNSVDFTIREIEAAQGTDTLVHINSRTPVLISALLKSGDKTSNITHVITSFSDAINKRLIELTIEKFGTPPCDFAFMALGSEARREQTLATDQDNAIIFEDIEDNYKEKAYLYFTQLAKEVNTKLNKIGFKFCKGDVMAMNPKWTQPLTVWKKYFSDWIQSSDPQSILDSSIFFDIRCIYGKPEITNELLDHIHDQSEAKAVFFQHMSNPILRFKSRVSMFGGIVGDEDSGDGKRIDIKKIQLPITTFARLYALKHKVNETNTLKRLDKLLKMGLLPPKIHHEMEMAYGILMQLRLRFQTESIINNETPDNLVDISKLTSIEVSTLKKVLSELSDLQTQVSFDFKGSI